MQVHSFTWATAPLLTWWPPVLSSVGHDYAHSCMCTHPKHIDDLGNRQFMKDMYFLIFMCTYIYIYIQFFLLLAFTCKVTSCLGVSGCNFPLIAKLVTWLCSTDVEILSVKLPAFSCPLRIHRSPPPLQSKQQGGTWPLPGSSATFQILILRVWQSLLIRSTPKQSSFIVSINRGFAPSFELDPF